MFLLGFAGVFNPSLWKVQPKFNDFDNVSLRTLFHTLPTSGLRILTPISREGNPQLWREFISGGCMAHYGLLRDYRFEDLNTEDDIRGSNVYGRNDEKLGKIDDVIFDHATGSIRFVVVDTGGWFTHKKFLVPP